MSAPTSTVSGQLALAGTARSVQLAIRARLISDVTKLWPLLDPKQLDQTFPGWLKAMQLLVTSYHGQSATAAARFYQAARAAAIQSPTPATLIKTAPPPALAWMAQAFGFSGPGMVTREIARPNTALSTTIGTAARIALDGGRTTVLDTAKTDPVALGYYRVTDGHPCAFCALLASRVALKGRGALYRSEESASFQAHNDCGCSAAPLFSHDQQLPEVSTAAAEVYRNRGKGNALVAFRKAWSDHQAAQPA